MMGNCCESGGAMAPTGATYIGYIHTHAQEEVVEKTVMGGRDGNCGGRENKTARTVDVL